MKTKNITIIFLTCFLFLFSTYEEVFGADSKILYLATGSKIGVYYPVGKGIAEVAKEANIEINVLNSEGSRENLHWLSQGKAQLCLAQSDTVYNAYNGLGRFSEKITNIQAIASLYTEAVHILIRSTLYIKKIEDFRGKRISIGSKGSGTESNARAVLEASGITPNEFQLLNLSSDEAIQSLKENNVDIVFITSGTPSEAVKNILQDNIAFLFELHPDILQRLINTYPYFVITAISTGTYAHQNEDITTIGVSALLVGRNDLNVNLVYNLTKSIFTNTNAIERYHQKGSSIKLKSAFKGIAIPIFEGANNFYREKGLHRKRLYRMIMNVFLAILLLLVLIIAIIKFNEIRYFFKRKELARVFVFLLLIWFAGSIMLYFAENKINENYSNVFMSFWSGLITMISLPDKEPFTFTGRTTAIVMMILGVGGIAWFTGEVASIFVHKKLMGGKRKMEKIKNHYVIVNWNDKGYGIIEQLHSVDFADKKPIIVITESSESISFPEKHEYEATYIVKGNPTSEAILRRANIHNAHSIIILAEDVMSNVSDAKLKSSTALHLTPLKAMSDISDAKSILIMLAIRKICIEEKAKQVPIIAEILDPQKVQLAVYAGIKGDGNVEIVSSQNLGKSLLAQAAVNPGLTNIYEELLTFGKESNEIYRSKVPSKLVGKPFNELFRWVIDLTHLPQLERNIQQNDR